MSSSQAFGYRFVRYLAIIFGAGLMGWGIGGAPVGFAIGIGAGIVVAGAVWRFALALEAAAEPRPVRISLDQDDFARLIRGQVVGHPGGVRIALRDIGWTVMIAEIQRAHSEAVDVS